MQLVSLWVRRIEAFVLSTAMLVMAAATILNVFARNVTGDSLAVTEELNALLIVVVCFVGLSYAAGQGRHIRMTAISDALPARLRRWLVLFMCLSTAFLLVYLSFYAARYAWGVDRTSPVMGVPLRWVFLIAPVGLVLGAVQYFLAAVRTLRGPDIHIAYEVLDTHVAIDLGDVGELGAPTGDEEETAQRDSKRGGEA